MSSCARLRAARRSAASCWSFSPIPRQRCGDMHDGSGPGASWRSKRSMSICCASRPPSCPTTCDVGSSPRSRRAVRNLTWGGSCCARFSLPAWAAASLHLNQNFQDRGDAEKARSDVEPDFGGNQRAFDGVQTVIPLSPTLRPWGDAPAVRDYLRFSSNLARCSLFLIQAEGARRTEVPRRVTPAGVLRQTAAAPGARAAASEWGDDIGSAPTGFLLAA
jgi:hypothetical protein